MRPPAASLLAAALAAALLGACGRPPSAPPSEEDLVRWWPGDAPRPRGGIGLGHRDLAVLTLPQAPAGGVDEAPPARSAARRIIVNLEADGDLYFRGIVVPLEAAGARDVLRRELSRLAARPGSTFVLLRADRRCPWGEVRRLIDGVTTVPEIEVASVHFAVDVGSAADGRIEARAGWGAPRGDAPAASIEFGVEESPAGLFPRLRIGASEWAFPAGDPYARGPALDGANAAWVQARDALRRLPHGEAATPVSIDPRVPWAHVAQLLALANGTGLKRLAVGADGAELTLELSAPARVAGPRGAGRPDTTATRLEPGERDPRDASPALLVAIGVALAAIVVLLPLVRGRRRVRTPPRSA